MGPPGLQISERKSVAFCVFTRDECPELRSQLFNAAVKMQSTNGLASLSIKS